MVIKALLALINKFFNNLNRNNMTFLINFRNGKDPVKIHNISYILFLSDSLSIVYKEDGVRCTESFKDVLSIFPASS